MTPRKNIAQWAGLLCIAAAITAFSTLPDRPEPKERGLVEVFRFINDTLVGDSLQLFMDGRRATPQEVEAVDPENILSTTILYGGRPYIDHFIRSYMASLRQRQAETAKQAPAPK